MERTRYEVRRISVFSAVKTLFLLGGFTGFLMGLVQWAFMELIWWAGSSLTAGIDLQGQSALEDMLGGAIQSISMFFPILGGFMGAVGGAILGLFLAMIYNLSVRFWGGLELEWEMIHSPAVVAPLQGTPGEQTPLPVMRADATPPAPPPSADVEPVGGESEKPPSSAIYE